MFRSAFESALFALARAEAELAAVLAVASEAVKVESEAFRLMEAAAFGLRWLH